MALAVLQLVRDGAAAAHGDHLGDVGTLLDGGAGEKFIQYALIELFLFPFHDPEAVRELHELV